MPRLHLVQARALRIEPVEAVPRVSPPRTVIDALRHRLAELTVTGNIDADILLSAHDLRDRRPELIGKDPRIVSGPRRDQIVGSREAPRVTGQDMIGTRPHDLLLTPELAARGPRAGC